LANLGISRKSTGVQCSAIEARWRALLKLAVGSLSSLESLASEQSGLQNIRIVKTKNQKNFWRKQSGEKAG